jgi:hypothetical protein
MTECERYRPFANARWRHKLAGRGESQFADDNEIEYQPDAMREPGFLGGERLRELSRAAELIAVRICHRMRSFTTCSSCATRMASVKGSRQ